jgi:nicotinamide-nucleotide amidase
MEKLLPAAGAIAEKLKARRETLAIAESSAGGLISAAMLAVPGASRYFLAGAIVYTRQARENLLAITDADMEGMRSSSEPYAAFLAERARARHGATWGLAETGAAGPSGNRYGDSAGHTCIAIAGPRGHVMTLETGQDDRAANMYLFAATALGEFDRVLG